MNRTLKITLLVTGGVLLLGYVYRRQIKAGAKVIVNYAFSKEQNLFLDELHPDYRDVFKKFIAEIETTTPYKVLVTSGNRTFQKQAQLHKENSSNAKAGKSMHNYGLAIDINLVSKKDGSLIRKSDSSETWEKTGVVNIAKKLGLTWGGKGQFGSYHDPVHFEIDKDGSKLYAQAIKQFGIESKVIGNQVKLVA